MSALCGRLALTRQETQVKNHIRDLVSYVVWEAWVYLMIALDLVLGFLTWLLIIGLVPHDMVDFNVLGSLVMIAVMSVPYYFVSRYVRRLVA